MVAAQCQKSVPANGRSVANQQGSTRPDLRLRPKSAPRLPSVLRRAATPMGSTLAIGARKVRKSASIHLILRADKRPRRADWGWDRLYLRVLLRDSDGPG